MKNLFFPLLFIVFSVSAQPAIKPSQYVDPMIGTGGHGHTFPGATVPFGMVQLSPDTRIDGSWDGCSGYHYSDSVIYGFSHTHLSGTGCSDYGDILLFPLIENIKPDDLMDHKYSSAFKHENEKASAGYYYVGLDNGVKVELTATPHVGFHKYIFPKSEYAYIILDLELRDKVIDASAVLRENRKIVGYRQSEAWAKNQMVMYALEFSEPFIDATTFNGSVLSQDEPVSGTKVRICFKFKMPSNGTIMTKVALSPVTIEGAEKNMMAECPHWDFEKIKEEAEGHWNNELDKIDVTSSDKNKLKIFYTALYHTMIQPNVAMDVDSMYRGRDDKLHKAHGFTYYSVFSLWDTFRAAHPLYTIIDQKRTADFINTFLAQYEQGGRLPVWELSGNETDCMIGYHSVSVIADAMVKGIKGFDYEKAYEASKHSAMLDHFGLKAYKEKGFISMEDEHESVSKTLEYAYDDWCIAQMAKLLKKESDHEYFMKRSQSWKNVFDPETGFMRPKKNGGWFSPFDPREVNNSFTEGNSWQYTFFVPHDIPGLISMMGGEKKFEQQLDKLFTVPSQTTGREQADITGLIGQYAHGNEPSHHMAYLYNYIGKSAKTQEQITQILTEFYKPTPDGLIGNEDCGQMSAWYVLSSMGFYQVTPGMDFYKIGKPFFDNVKIHLENGKEFSIETENHSLKNRYIAYGDFNKIDLTTLNHNSIIGGGRLFFRMSDKPNNEWNQSLLLWPQGYPLKKIIPVPVISATTRVFDDSTLIEIVSPVTAYIAVLETGQSVRTFHPYTKPFYIHSSKNIFAYADDGETKSDTVQALFYKRPNNWKIQINGKYNSQYTAGGDLGIIDGLRGELNWRKGEWQGYQYQNLEAIIDLGEKLVVSEYSAGFLQDSRSWILMPSKVEFYTSTDNKKFKLAGTIFSGYKWDDYKTQTWEFSITGKPVKARYVKIKVYNYGKLPEGHPGAGDGAFFFIDEISIR